LAVDESSSLKGLPPSMGGDIEDETITHSSAGLGAARTVYFATDNEDELIDSYMAWVEKAAYIILEDKYDKGTYRCFRGAKRGDDFYCKKTVDRFSQIVDNVNAMDFHVGHSRTSAALVTLTYAKQHEGNWKLVSQDFNRFMAMLRKRYGKVYAVRVWESHESGLPHVHVILLFESRTFKVFRYNKVYRLEKKSELAECWNYGFSDWRAIYDLEGALGYLMKYLRKFLNHEVEYAARNLAKLWVYGKRTFSVSQRLDSALRNSNHRMARMWQETLDGEIIEAEPHDWRLVCVVASMVDLTKVQIMSVKQIASSGWISRYSVSYR